MSEIDELLNSEMEYIESESMVNDEIVVNPITRMMDVPISERLFGVVEDANVEKKYFRCPRYVGDDIDLSKLKIYMKYVHAVGNTPEEWEDTIPQFTWCDDVKVDRDDIVWTWKLSANVFTKKGFMAFAMVAKDENTVAFNTYPAIGTVLTTIPYGSEEISMMYPDIVTQLLRRMDSVEAIATPEAMQNYVNTYLEANPLQLDEALKDDKKAAPANIVGELKEELNQSRKCVENGYYPVDLIDNLLVYGSDGHIETNTAYKSTKKIDVYGKYVYIYSETETYTNAFYDKTDTFVSGFHLSAGENVILVPQNAKKYRLSGKNENIINTIIRLGSVTESYNKIIEGLPYVTPQMFGAKADGVTDDTVAIQKAIDSGRKVVIPATEKFYAISKTLTINRNSVEIVGENRESLHNDDRKVLLKAINTFYSFFKLEENSSSLRLENLTIDCDSKVNAGIFHSNDYKFLHDLYFECVAVENAINFGYYFGAVYKSTFINLRALKGECGFVITGDKNTTGGTTIILINCYSDYADKYGFKLEYINYSSMISCACDHTKIAYTFGGCKALNMISCGCEHIKTPIYMSQEIQNVAININGLFAMFLENNTEMENDALIYCGQVQNVVISGIIATEGVKKTYDIYATKDIASIVVLDTSVNPLKCYTPKNTIKFVAYNIVSDGDTPMYEGQIVANNGNIKIGVMQDNTLIFKEIILKEMQAKNY